MSSHESNCSRLCSLPLKGCKLFCINKEWCFDFDSMRQYNPMQNQWYHIDRFDGAWRWTNKDTVTPLFSEKSGIYGISASSSYDKMIDKAYDKWIISKLEREMLE